MKQKPKKDRRSLYQRIDEFVASYLRDIKNDGHFPTTARKEAAESATRNILGNIRAIKGDFDFNKKDKP